MNNYQDKITNQYADLNGKKIVIIDGPTASGKTYLIHNLIERYYKKEDYVIINSDSRLLYCDLNIATDKPSKKEISQYSYKLVDLLSLKEIYSAYRFVQDSLEIINSYKRKKIFIVGGSNFYISALLNGLPPSEKSYYEAKKQVLIKEEINRSFDKYGLEYFLKELEEKDPVCFFRIDIKNPRRVLRAIEFIRLTGKLFSDHQAKQKPLVNFDIQKISLLCKRKNLYNNINERVERMFAKGLLKEASYLLNNFSEDLEDIIKTGVIGYKEAFAILNKEICLKEGKEKIKQLSRNLAKRQISWLKKNKSGIYFMLGYNDNFSKENYLSYIDKEDQWFADLFFSNKSEKQAEYIFLNSKEDLVSKCQLIIENFYEKPSIREEYEKY